MIHLILLFKTKNLYCIQIYMIVSPFPKPVALFRYTRTSFLLGAHFKNKL